VSLDEMRKVVGEGGGEQGEFYWIFMAADFLDLMNSYYIF
jgi:hypothetical protein